MKYLHIKHLGQSVEQSKSTDPFLCQNLCWKQMCLLPALEEGTFTRTKGRLENTWLCSQIFSPLFADFPSGKIM